MRARRLAATVLVASPLLHAAALGAQVTAGQVDTFEGGTTQGWVVGDPSHPAPPTNIATGGPAGAGDNYLQLTAVGGATPASGAGGRLAVLNFAQWSGDYRAAGVGSITMDAANFGTSDLFLRLLWADPAVMGPPQNIAITSTALMLPAGSGWTRLTFDIGPGSLLAVAGNAETALTDAAELRIFHNPAADFPGPPIGIPAIVATLGVDNITAVAVVPEPSTMLLMGSGLLLLPLLRRRRRTG